MKFKTFKKQKISVINRSTGKFRTETINNREHLVTSMMVIEGDSVMNELFYPNKAVMTAMAQLDMLPAPDGHPNIDGEPVSAFNPLAINAHNIGGFTRSPIQDKKRVITDLVIDLDIANKSERGKKIIAKIKNGERIGVSTGLIADLTESSGRIDKQNFYGTVQNISFDHVAVLLDANPAGENTYTINHSNIKPKKRGMTMDEITFDLTPLAVGDRLKISNLTLNELLAHVNHKLSVDEATAIVNEAGLQVNSLKSDDVAIFNANKVDFELYKAEKLKKTNETKDFIVANSKMTTEQLANMSVEQLDNLASSVAPNNTYIGNGNSGDENTLELLDDNKLAKGE